MITERELLGLFGRLPLSWLAEVYQLELANETLQRASDRMHARLFFKAGVA